MLHTVFYDTRNALLSVRVWRVRAVRSSSSSRWRDRRTMLVESNPVERGGRRVRVGLDVAGLALTGQHSAALPPHCSALISLIAAVLQLERSSFSVQSSQSQSASGRDVVLVEYQFVCVTSSVLRWPEESYRPGPIVLVSISILLFLSYSLYLVLFIILIFTVVACSLLLFLLYQEQCRAHNTLLSGSSSCWFLS